MSYLIDLHLFLSAPVQNKPPEGTTTTSVKDIYYGSLPRHILDLEVEWARETTESRTDLVRTNQLHRSHCFHFLLTPSVATPSQVDAEFDENVLEDRSRRIARVGAPCESLAANRGANSWNLQRQRH